MDKLEVGAGKLGISLNHEQIAQFHIYYRELLAWNQRINLTGITSFEEVQVKHFLDSLTVIQALGQKEIGDELTIIDVGTGAGLPGIPIKIAFSEVKLVLLEATGKKVDFLNHLIGQLKLTGVKAIKGRAEEVAHDVQYREKFALVLARAVAGLPALAELALPFAAAGGIFVAQKKGEINAEVGQAASAIALMGGKLREVKEIQMTEFAEKRYLVVIDKISASPAKYPRRSGMPEKRPL
ncbi:16S rRNA (guanine(527)-N(7))-methyltransferase RsmG [Chloroflexota bacterium]